MGRWSETAVPKSEKAKQALIDALDNWDEAARTRPSWHVSPGGAHELYQVLCRYGVRDFRELGHKGFTTGEQFSLPRSHWLATRRADLGARSFMRCSIASVPRRTRQRLNLPADRRIEKLRARERDPRRLLDGKRTPMPRAK